MVRKGICPCGCRNGPFSLAYGWKLSEGDTACHKKGTWSVQGYLRVERNKCLLCRQTMIISIIVIAMSSSISPNSMPVVINTPCLHCTLNSKIFWGLLIHWPFCKEENNIKLPQRSRIYHWVMLNSMSSGTRMQGIEFYFATYYLCASVFWCVKWVFMHSINIDYLAYARQVQA